MLSRRTFLRLTGASLPAVFVWPGVPFRAALAGPVNLGLFFDAERLETLRRSYVSPLFAPLRAEIEAFDREAERRFMATEVRLNDQLYDIPRLHNAAPRMAFHYAMTGDEDAAALAVEAVRTLLRFPKWDYFLEGGTDVIGLQRAPGSSVAVACASDWLGDYLDASERAAWLEAMAERGLEPSFLSIYGMRHPERVRGWSLDPESTYLEHRPGDKTLDLSNWPHILDRTNLKAVPASALAIGAAAYERQFGRSEKTDRWIEQAVFSISTFRDLYARDGSYDEGVSYANYTSQHLAQATHVLQRLRGLDLYDLVNWPGFMDYVAGLMMPTDGDPHGIVNFGDAGSGLRSDVAFWIAGRSGDARAQWFGEERAHAHTEWSLIWYDPERPAQPPPDGPSVWHSDLDWMTARTGYGVDDLVVALRSGGPSNHEHADRNGLVVKCFGEVLVADPYRPPYSQADPSWMMRTTAGHSALLIGGEGHQYHDGSEGTNASDAVARIVRAYERDGYALWSSDATPAYALVRPGLGAVTRTVVTLFDVPAVLVLDKVIFESDPATLQARFFVYNMDGEGHAEASGNAFAIHRPGARLHAFAHAAGGATASAERLPIPEDVAAKHPFAAVAAPSANAPLLVTALVPVESGDEAPVVSFEADGDAVVLTIAHGGRQKRVRVVDSAALPEVIVEA